MRIINLLILIVLTSPSYSQEEAHDYFPFETDASLKQLIDQEKDTTIYLLDFYLKDTVENKTIYSGSGFLNKVQLADRFIRIERYLIGSSDVNYKFQDVLIVMDTDNYLLIESFDCMHELTELAADTMSFYFLQFFKTKDSSYLEKFEKYLNENAGSESMDLVRSGALRYFLFSHHFLQPTKSGKYKPSKSFQFIRYIVRHRHVGYN